MNTKMRRYAEFGMIFIKGMAMGAVELVPGVSGGTIAFICGIYERLLAAISACTPVKLGWLLQGRFRETWKAIDGTFLLVLLAGMAVSIITLARFILYLLEAQPEIVWSFFFGLILVSVPMVGRQIQRWNLWIVLTGVAGLLFAYLILVAAPIQLPETRTMIFFGSALAICAWLLPGISGSFVLLVLGLYAPVLYAIKTFDLNIIGVVMLGCLAGLLCFSRLLSWLLEHARNVTLAFLTGLMTGSLYKIWPWKQVITWRENSRGEMVPLLENNVWPTEYQAVTGEPSHWVAGLALMLLAVVLVSALEWWGRRASH